MTSSMIATDVAQELDISTDARMSMYEGSLPRRNTSGPSCVSRR